MSNVRDLVIINESDPKKLPEAYASLLDPTVPLPIDVRFYPLVRSWKNVRNRIVFALIALLIGLVAAYFTIKLSGFLGSLTPTNNYSETKAESQITAVPAAIAIIGILGGLIILNSTRNTIRIVRARQSGAAYRFGLFVSPQALLIQEEGNYVFLGKDRILKVERASSGRTELVYKDDKPEKNDKSGDSAPPKEEEKLRRSSLPDKLETMSPDEIFKLAETWYAAA